MSLQGTGPSIPHNQPPLPPDSAFINPPTSDIPMDKSKDGSKLLERRIVKFAAKFKTFNPATRGRGKVPTAEFKEILKKDLKKISRFCSKIIKDTSANSEELRQALEDIETAMGKFPDLLGNVESLKQKLKFAQTLLPLRREYARIDQRLEKNITLFNEQSLALIEGEKGALLDPSIKEYVAAVECAEALMKFLAESKMTLPMQLDLVKKIQGHMKQISNAALDFRDGVLKQIKEELHQAQKDLISAKKKILITKDKSLPQQMADIETYQKAVSHLQYLKTRYKPTFEALSTLEGKLKIHILPEPESWSSYFLPSLSYDMGEDVQDRTNKLCKEYAQLRLGMTEDTKTIQKLLSEVDKTLGDKSAEKDLLKSFAGPNVHLLKKWLLEPFENTKPSRSKPNEFLILKERFALMLALEERASGLVKSVITEARREAQSMLSFEYEVPPPSARIYDQIYSEKLGREAQQQLKSWHGHLIKEGQEINEATPQWQIHAANLALHLMGESSTFFGRLQQRNLFKTPSAVAPEKQTAERTTDSTEESPQTFETTKTASSKPARANALTDELPPPPIVLELIAEERKPPIVEPQMRIVKPIPTEDDVIEISTERPPYTPQTSAATRTHNIFVLGMAKTLFSWAAGLFTSAQAASQSELTTIQVEEIAASRDVELIRGLLDSPKTEVDLRLLQHILNSYSGGGTGLEGYYAVPMIQHIHRIITQLIESIEANPLCGGIERRRFCETITAKKLMMEERQLVSLFNNISKLMKRSQALTAALKGSYADFRAEMMRLLKPQTQEPKFYEYGDSFFFQGGWTGREVGHSIVNEIEPQPNGKYTMRIYNRGAGAEFYTRADVEAQEQMLSLTEIVDIELENLLNPIFLATLQQFQHVPAKGEDWKPKDYFNTLLRLLKGRISSRVYTGDAMMERLDVGHCTYLSLTGLLSYSLSSNVRYRRLEHFIELKTLHDFYYQHRDNLAADEQTLNLLTSSLQQFDKNLQSAAAKGFISSEALVEENAIVAEIRAGLAVAIAAKRQADERAAIQPEIVAEPNTPFTHQSLLDIPIEAEFVAAPPATYVKIDTTKWRYDPKTFFNDLQGFVPKILEASNKGLHNIVRESIKELVAKIEMNWTDRPIEEWAVAPSAFWNHLSVEQAEQTLESFRLLGVELLFTHLKLAKEDPSRRGKLPPDDIIAAIKLVALADALGRHYPNGTPIFIEGLCSENTRRILLGKQPDFFTYDPVWSEEQQALRTYFTAVDTSIVQQKDIELGGIFVPSAFQVVNYSLIDLTPEFQFALRWLKRPEVQARIASDSKYNFIRTSNWSPELKAIYIALDIRRVRGVSHEGRWDLLPPYYFQMQDLVIALNALTFLQTEHDSRIETNKDISIRRVGDFDLTPKAQFEIFGNDLNYFGHSIFNLNDYTKKELGGLPVNYSPLHSFKVKKHFEREMRLRLAPHERLIQPSEKFGTVLSADEVQDTLAVSIEELQAREVFRMYVQNKQRISGQEGFSVINRLALEGDGRIQEFRNHPNEVIEFAQKLANEHGENYETSLALSDIVTAVKELHFIRLYSRAFNHVKQKYPESIPPGAHNPFKDTSKELQELLKIPTLPPDVKKLILAEITRSYVGKEVLSATDVQFLLYSKIAFDWDPLPIQHDYWSPDRESERRDASYKLRIPIQNALTTENRDAIFNGTLKKLFPNALSRKWEIDGAYPRFKSTDGDFIIDVLNGKLTEKGAPIRQLPQNIRQLPALKELFGEEQNLYGAEISPKKWIFKSPDGDTYQLIPSTKDSYFVSFKDKLGRSEYLSPEEASAVQRLIDGRWYRYLNTVMVSDLPYQALLQTHHVWIQTPTDSKPEIKPEILLYNKMTGQIAYRIALKFIPANFLEGIQAIYSNVKNSLIESDSNNIAGQFATESVNQLDDAGNENGLILTNIYDRPGGYAPLLRFESAEYINIFQDQHSHAPVSIDLPRFNLQFTPKKVQNLWRAYSNQFPGFYISKKQYHPELGDVSHYLVLEKNLGQGNTQRLILLPLQTMLPLNEPRLETVTQPFRQTQATRGMNNPQRYAVVEVVELEKRTLSSKEDKQILVTLASASAKAGELRPVNLEGRLYLASLHLWERRYEQAFNYLLGCGVKDRYCFHSGEQRRPFSSEELKQLAHIFHLQKDTQDKSPESLAISLYAAMLIVRDAKDFSHRTFDNLFYRELITLLNPYLQKIAQTSLINLNEREQLLLIKEALTYDPQKDPEITLNPNLVNQLLAIQIRIQQRAQKIEQGLGQLVVAAPVRPINVIPLQEPDVTLYEWIKAFYDSPAQFIEGKQSLLRSQVRAVLEEMWTAIADEDYGKVVETIGGFPIPPGHELPLREMAIQVLDTVRKSFHDINECIAADVLFNALFLFEEHDHLRSDFRFLSNYKHGYSLLKSDIIDRTLQPLSITAEAQGPNVLVGREQQELIPLPEAIQGNAKVPDAFKVTMVAKPPPFLQQPLVSNLELYFKISPPSETDRAAAVKRGAELSSLVTLPTENDSANRRLNKAKRDIQAFYASGGGIQGQKQIVSLEKLNELNSKLLDRLKGLEDNIAIEEESLIAYANTSPKDPKPRAFRDTRFAANLDKPISLLELRHHFHTANMAALFPRNPFLGKRDFHNIFARLQSNEIQVVYAKLIRKAINLIGDIKTASLNKAPELPALLDKVCNLLAMVRQYDVSKYPAYLELERVLSGVLREDQMENLQRLDETRPKPNSDQLLGAVIEMPPGAGKTSALVPSEAVKNANGKNLAIIVLPEQLIDSQLPEMQTWLGEAYGMLVQTFKIERSDKMSVEELERLLQRLHEITVDRSVLVVTDTTIQSFFLKFIEKAQGALVMIQGKASPKDMKVMEKEIALFVQILGVFRKSGVVIIDEVDFILDVLKASHFTSGTPRPLKAETVVAVSQFFTYLVRDILRTNLMQFNFLSSSRGQPFTEADYQEHIQPNFVQATVNGTLCRDDPEMSQFFKETSVIEQGYLTEYLNNRPNAAAEDFVRQIPSMKIKNILAVLKEVITQIFPLTAAKLPDEHYGFIPPAYYNKRSDYRVAIPYHSNNNPALNSQFGTYLEQAVITLMLYLNKGVSDEILFDEITEIQGIIREEISRGTIKGWKQSKLYPQFLKLVGHDPDVLLFNIVKKEDAKPFLNAIKKDHELMIYLTAKHVLKQVKIFPEQLHTSGQIYDALFHLTKGFTGTLAPDSLPDMFYEKFTSKAFEETLDEIWKSSPKDVAIIHAKPSSSTNVKTLVHELYTLRKGFKGSFIDYGCIFRGTHNEAVAKEIINQPIWEGTEIEGIIFYNEDNEIMVMWRGDKPGNERIEPYKAGIKTKNLIAYYDHAHTRGADLKLPSTAVATESFSRDATAAGNTQGVNRLRDLKWGQKTDFVVAEEDAQVILSTLNRANKAKLKKIGLGELVQYSLYHEGVKESDDNYRAVLHKITGLLVNRVIETLTSEELSAAEILEILDKTRNLYVLTSPENPYEEMGAITTLGPRKEVMEAVLDKFFQSPEMAAFAELPILKKRYSIGDLKQAAKDIVSRDLSKLPAQLSVSPTYNRQVLVKVETQTNVENQVKKETKTKLHLNIRLRSYDTSITEARPIIPWTSSKLFSRNTYIPVSYDSASKMSAREISEKGFMLISYQEAFSGHISTQEYAESLEGSGTLNLMPVYPRANANQPLWIPFGTYADIVRHQLIIQDNSTQAIRIIDLDQEDARQIRLMLRKDRALPWKGQRDVRVALYNPFSGIEEQGHERIEMDALKNNAQAMREMVIAKLRVGEQQYNQDEIPFLKAYIKEKGPEKMYTLFYDKLMSGPIELVGSEIEKVFESFGIIRSERQPK